MKNNSAIRLILVLLVACSITTIAKPADVSGQTYPFKLPELGYAYDALEPNIDARTLEIHHSKHHAGYVSKLNDALKGYEYLQKYSLETLLMNVEAMPVDIRDAVRDNAGGHLHHAMFWDVMKPGGSKEPSGEILDAIKANFNSVENFKAVFAKSAAGRVGSGWTWLVMDQFGMLHVFSTTDHNSPVSDGYIPIMVLDVWEHAYYLKYQNRRGDFISSFWNVLNWDVVAENFKKAKETIAKASIEKK